MSRSGQKQMITILRRVSIILDFLCKAMGVIVSYFEIVQNRNPDYGEKDRGHSCLMMTMTKTHRRVAGIWQKKTIYLLGRAAYSIAMEQVVEAMKDRRVV